LARVITNSSEGMTPVTSVTAPCGGAQAARSVTRATNVSDSLDVRK
jgi:hypothetical protein